MRRRDIFKLPAFLLFVAAAPVLAQETPLPKPTTFTFGKLVCYPHTKEVSIAIMDHDMVLKVARMKTTGDGAKDVDLLQKKLIHWFYENGCL